MERLSISLLPILALAASCGGSGSNDAAAGESAVLPVSEPSNEQVLGLVYNSEYHVPDGFFVDERAKTTTRSYSVYHVLDESNSYELCTDDLVEAQAWEQADNEARSVGGQYITSYENERYFEIVRELAYEQGIGNIDDPTSPGYARVFKCEHTNRTGVDRSLLDGYSGRLNAAELNDRLLAEFTEYLWQFRFFNVTRKIVLDSYSTAPMNHTLLLALVVNQGTGACDRVDIIEWHFRANPTGGEVTREFELVRSFDASIANGVPEFCQ